MDDDKYTCLGYIIYCDNISILLHCHKNSRATRHISFFVTDSIHLKACYHLYFFHAPFQKRITNWTMSLPGAQILQVQEDSCVTTQDNDFQTQNHHSSDPEPTDSTATYIPAVINPRLENENPPTSTKECSTIGTYGPVENHNLYIPVGTLMRYTAQDTDALSTPKRDDFPHSEVSNLEKHHWIWTSTYAYKKDHRWSYVRVYVLPDDVGRKIIPRSSTPLRRALKVIMAKIDRSPAAWSGCSSLDNMTTNISQHSNEDESLWYIFNTLQNPVPNPDLMRDQYTNKAMQQLLSVSPRKGDYGLDGFDDGAKLPREYSCVPYLRTALYPYQRRSAAVMIQREAQPTPMLDPRLKPYVTPTGQEYYYDKEEGNIIREKRMYSEPRGGTLF